MPNRAARPAIILAGIALIAVTLSYLLFWKTGPFEAMTADFRPLMNPGTVAQLNADIDGLEAAAQEYDTALIPAIAQRTGTSVAALKARFAVEYPAVTAGMAAIPQAGPSLSAIAGTFGTQQALFEKSDEIPTKGMTTTGIPWALTGAGIVALLLAGPAMRRRGSAVAAVVLGVVLTLTPLLILMPSKAAAADRLNENLSAIMTPARVTQLDQTVVVLQAMTTEITTTMLPAVPTQLQIPATQVNAFLAQNFPAIAAAVQNAPVAIARAETLAGVFATNLPRYQEIRPVSFRVITWTSIAAGLVLIVAGVLAYGTASQVSVFETRQRRRRGERSVEAA